MQRDSAGRPDHRRVCDRVRAPGLRISDATACGRPGAERVRMAKARAAKESACRIGTTRRGNQLKAPKRLLKAEDTQQIRSYAYAVSSDERFKGLDTTRDFWLVGNDLSDYVERELDNDEARGVLQRTADGRMRISVRRWSELIQEARARLDFVQKELDYEVNRDHTLERLRATYAHLLGGVEDEAGSHELMPTAAETQQRQGKTTRKPTLKRTRLIPASQSRSRSPATLSKAMFGPNSPTGSAATSDSVAVRFRRDAQTLPLF